jgi:DNA-damage-inducible protein D
MNSIKLFESQQVRTVWNETDQKWYFVVVDVVKILTDSVNPSDYIKKIRKRDLELAKGWGQIVPTLSVETAGGKHQLKD